MTADAETIAVYDAHATEFEAFVKRDGRLDGTVTGWITVDCHG